MNVFYAVAPAGLIALYLVSLVSVMVPALQDYSQILLLVSGALLVLHVVEYVVVKKRLDACPGSTARHFIKTVLFGFTYWVPLLKKQ